MVRTEKKATAVFPSRQTGACLFSPNIHTCMTLSATVSCWHLFIPSDTYPAHASPVCVQIQEEVSPESLPMYSLMSSRRETKAKDMFSYKWAKVSTFHRAKQLSNPEESPILVLLQACRNHWSLANNYFASIYWPSCRSMYFTSLSWFSFCFYPILWDRILIYVLHISLSV